jgi:hypothetical protein
MGNPPIVIEVRSEEGTTWLLSFGGSNPQKEECIELPKDQCFWLEKQIMNIPPNLLARTRDLPPHST